MTGPSAESDHIDREALAREIRRRYTGGIHVNETGFQATIRIALDVFAESFAAPAAPGALGPDHCPTCGAETSSDHCATKTGRDHPTRRLWARAYRHGVSAARRAHEGGQSDA